MLNTDSEIRNCVKIEVAVPLGLQSLGSVIASVDVKHHERKKKKSADTYSGLQITQWSTGACLYAVCLGHALSTRWRR